MKEELLAIGQEAGKAILERKALSSGFELKGDSSPVTDADLESHKILKKRLMSLTPKIPVVSEEDFEEVPEQPYWLIDPLDGTKEFIDGLDDFTVNIALIDRNRPTLGLVHLPSSGVTYFGDATGAWKYASGNFQNIGVSSMQLEPRVVTSRSHIDRETRDFISRLGSARVIAAGSSLKFCLVAEGQADIYPRFGRTMEWDTAAGQAVLESAGGFVLNAHTKETMSYGKPGLANSAFLALSSEVFVAGLG